MYRPAGLLVLAAFALHAQSSSVGVYLEFDQKPSEASLDAMKREAAAILAPSGVALAWRWLEQNHGTESFGNLAVMRFKGSCWAGNTAPIAEDGGTSVLASTEVGDGHVLPFSQVECDQVRRTMFGSGGQRDSILGRALGRVVAHELFHILGRTGRHATRGVTKSIFGWQELTGKTLRMEKEDRALLGGERGPAR